MPRLTARGQAVMGVGDGIVSVDGVTVARGGCTCPLTQHTFIYSGTDGVRWWLATFNLETGEIVELPGTTGANELAAGGGRWLAWQASRGVYGSWQDPRAGLSLVDGDGRGGAGEDGTLAMIADRQTGVGLQLHAPSGAVALAPSGTIARQVHVLGPARAIWRTDAGALQTMGLSVPVQAGPAYGPRWVDVPGQTPWVVYWTASRGLVAHPIDSLIGVVVATGDQAFYHDARVVGGRLRVAYSRGQGELPHDLVTVPDIFPWARVDFTVAPKPDPVDPPTDPPIDPPVDPPETPVFTYDTGPLNIYAQARWQDRPHSTREEQATELFRILYNFREATGHPIEVFRKGTGGTHFLGSDGFGYAEDICVIVQGDGKWWKDVGVAFGAPSASLNFGQDWQLTDQPHNCYPPPAPAGVVVVDPPDPPDPPQTDITERVEALEAKVVIQASGLAQITELAKTVRGLTAAYLQLQDRVLALEQKPGGGGTFDPMQWKVETPVKFIGTSIGTIKPK